MKISNFKCLLFFIGCVLPNFLDATWNLPPLTIPDSSTNVITPSVGIDDAGNAVAVFAAFDGANFVIQGSTLPFGGVAWTAPVTISATGQDSENPRVTVKSNGDAVAVWSRFDGSNEIVQSSQLPFGGSWTSAADVSSTGIDGLFARVVMNTSGQTVTVWANFDGVNYSIAASSLQFGGLWTMLFDASAPNPGENQKNPRVAIDQNGNAVAVWERDTGSSETIQASTIPFGGSPSAPMTISGSGSAFSPAIDIDDGGNAIALWSEFNGTDAVIRSAQLPFGGNWSTPVDITAAGESGTLSQVKFDVNSNVVAIWSRYDSANAVIKGSTMLFGGGWSTPVNISDVSESSSHPVLGIDIGGNAIAVWDTASNKVQTSSYTFDDATWSSPLDLSNNDGTASSLPDLAENLCSDAVVVWQNDNAGVNTIQSATNSCDLPTVTGVSPNVGPLGGGTLVTITGTHFFGSTVVHFGGVLGTGLTVVNSTKITVTSPAAASNSPCTVDVRVTTCCGTSAISAADHFTYNSPAPTVTGVSPNSGPLAGGTSVTITGTGFIGVTGAAGVKFGGVNAQSYTVSSATQIIAVSPAGNTCVVDITVTACGGTSATSPADQFTYTYGTPTVTGLSPSTGHVGDTITVNGTNFIGVTGVMFGGTPASFTPGTSTSLTVVVPATNDCTLDVRVTTCKGTSPITPADRFTYIMPAPTVTNVNPSVGPATSVVITGTGFISVTAVKFGTISAPSFTVNSATQITATIPFLPPNSPCTVDITVTACGGTSALNPPGDQFTYGGTPTVTGLTPGSGSDGTSVTITGTNFNGVTAVKFGGINATSFIVNSATQITVTAPLLPANPVSCIVNVTVTACGGTSLPSIANEFTYNALPTVTGLSSSSGTFGTSITITGMNFDGVTAVRFGSVNATSFTVNSGTQITATVPLLPANSPCVVNVIVTACGGTSASTSANQFTYTGLPTVTGISPSSGSDGTSVTITGTNFNGVTAVKFGTINATSFTVNSATQITATAPFLPANSVCTVDVTVTACGGTSATSPADHFTYNVVPTVTGVSPSGGSDGTSVTITGTHFDGVTAVKFGTINATSFTVNSATQIIATVPFLPANSVCTVDVTVTACGGTSATSPADHFTYNVVPTVTGVSPSSNSSGTSVTITGTNFDGVTSVKFGTVSAAFTVNSGTQITATVPVPVATSPCTVDVTVTACGGTSATSPADHFTYTDVPTVTGLSPTHASPSIPTSVTITGTNFHGVTSVQFGTVTTTFVVNSLMQIIADMPAPAANSPCTVDVTVTACGGTSATSSADQFTYDFAVPTVTSLSQTSGPASGNTTLMINGTNFYGVTAVNFGTVPATIISVTPTQITVKSPAAADDSPCTVDVTVTACGGTSATNPHDQFTYTNFPAPNLMFITPGSGNSAGGTMVTITGSNFHNPSTVSFGGVPGTGVMVVDSGTITVTAPAAAPNSPCTVDVIVTSCGQAASNSLTFSYNFPVPHISSLNPPHGPVGQLITITGTNFHAPASVDFGGVPGINPTVVDETTITVNAPEPMDCVVNVTVTTCMTQTSNSVVYTYDALAAPTVTGVDPMFGPAGGGNTVTISGTGFIGITNVAFGAHNSPSFEVISENTIMAVAPAGDQCDVHVVVTGCSGSSTPSSADIYQYVFAGPSALLDPVTVTSVSPNSGSPAGGTVVTIGGTGFVDVVTVQFGGVDASFSVNSPTSITAIAPAALPGSDCVVDVVVITCESGTSPITPADQFTYTFPAPTITDVSPNSGSPSGGTPVTITGTDFRAVTSVKFGDVEAAFTVDSITEITAIVPAGMHCQVDITVTACGGTSAITPADHYTYLFPAPSVTGVNPNSGSPSGGNTVEISGSNFADVTAVKFGNVNALDYTVNSLTSISAVVPAGINCDTVDVTVTACGGTSSITNADKYTYGTAPTITNINPSSGSQSGGNSVIITGTNLDGVTIVKFGNNNAQFVINSSTQITATVPAGSPGTVEVIVTNCVGTATGQYTYLSNSPQPPSKFIGCIKKDKFLNKTECFLEASWSASHSPNVVFYRIYRDNKVIDTIPAKSRLFFERKLSKCSAKGYSITAVNKFNQESTHVRLKLEK